MTDVDAFLAECDDVIADWEGSSDSATWAADGSHEHDTGGHYYGEDGVSYGYAPDWTILRDEILRRALPHMRRMMDAVVEAQLHMADNFATFDEVYPWRPDLVTDETKALLRQRKVDPMTPPAYLYRRRGDCR